MPQRTVETVMLDDGTELIDVSMFLEFDLTWREIDPSGHEHRWTRGEASTFVYNPDLNAHACRACSATVTPGTRRNPFRRYVFAGLFDRVEEL